ncbi:serine/threonine-protein kinase [Chondromyces apiculatus]|uniref:Serine/threonine protein kinase n=1 Tax=Chondromyces apiculatus DSM 436 TaxID=1192034 RepID=A0A017SYK7_9BACT|nr:serine/threonine-protein kinase [Chondromyces apiculatus]EYF01705.1 serine/threonine protein kinase [Chondromyces apiculatus DSM 436]
MDSSLVEGQKATSLLVQVFNPPPSAGSEGSLAVCAKALGQVSERQRCYAAHDPMQPISAKSCPSCGERYEADVLFCPRDGTPLQSARKLPGAAETDPYVGLELAGQVRIHHLIGIGSMGRVYRAFQGGIDRDVAVKILHREMSSNAELTGRFHREARIASRLVHPNVVQVLMSGSIPRGVDPRVGGELCLVMEHLDGISLLSALAAAGTGGEENALPLPRALHIILQICDAVGEAHAQGIVHRDLKPENIMLVRRGEDPDFVKVLDFGIARFDWADKAVSTQAGLIFGTAKYISPEGAEGKTVGPSADVYSIATMLYQCLAGRAPFEGDSPVALLVQHTHAPPPDLRSIARASYVPVPIGQVIMQNLAKKPEERACDARALYRDLAMAARESGLNPDEIQTSSRLTRTSGMVKLASKARTRALELSPELAARLGSAPTLDPGVDSSAETPSQGPEAGDDGTSGITSTDALPSRIEAYDLPAGVPLRSSTPLHPDVKLQSSTALSGTDGPVASSAPQRSESEEAAFVPGDDEDLLRSALEAPSTMHGVASEARPHPGRARLIRRATLAACVAGAGFLLVLGGFHLGSSGGPPPESLEAQIERARECMRRHAWDIPPGDNVKEIAERAQSRWPADGRVRDLRREAAERLVASALGSKYAGDLPGAVRLARLALQLMPEYTTAQHLMAELEKITQEGKTSIAPVTTSTPPVRPRPALKSSLPGVSTPPVHDASADPRAQGAPRAQPPSPTSTAANIPAPELAPSPELPPSPPPLSNDPASLPPVTGPWL